jgi:hypothetical protein
VAGAALATILTLTIEEFVVIPPKDVEDNVLLAAAPELEAVWEVVDVINCATVTAGWPTVTTTNVVGVTVVAAAALIVTALPLLVIPASV